jgi:hypothetical protein
VTLRFYHKSAFCGKKKLPETPYFLVVTPIFWVGYSE